jgi:Zn-dependent peptidase ImmA (M78 family)
LAAPEGLAQRAIIEVKKQMNRSDIEQRATQVLRDHGLLAVPVDPLRVANALGIKVMNAVFSKPEQSGAVAKRAEKFSIFVNANEPPARKRFTIAHEIGHQLLHMSGQLDTEFIDTLDNFRTTESPLDEGWSPERRKEWEANVFAASLLMNEELVRERWVNCQDTSRIAWMFQVSTTAMLVRLNQLGLLREAP